MATIIDGSTGIITQAIDIATPLSSAEGGTGLNSAGASGNLLTSNGTTWVSSANSGIGIGQTWQQFTTTTRAYGTTYTNSTGKPILMMHAFGRSNGGTFVLNGTNLAKLSHDSNNNSVSYFSIIIPNGATYGITGSYSSDSVDTTMCYWNELR